MIDSWGYKDKTFEVIFLQQQVQQVQRQQQVQQQLQVQQLLPVSTVLSMLLMR